MRKTCKDCKFFAEETAIRYPECRRRSPTWILNPQEENDFINGWPEVEPEVDWCGEFEDADPDHNY